ncbi:Putative peptidoglycan binding domain-containing protein [Palleronia marisminoris]|uniref:Putative peptidoglycan binding domain protein n=1 Tax=Palleronia marisminoris TaxID=315423 RepID=A0A1Y5SK69_9RHOB|nr:peptidoglycan-binding domain-containing protein [Palleronia marisminoris]SFG85311.1 Putative peptidoglycan binding domain-containing protein [Palleronia marisminoris]SLN42336.1 Putative peptidoglycan binding domain protein [Palleronia marisminoris]
MRVLLTALTLGLTATGPSLAAESALLIGNDRYDTLDGVDAARSIDDAGQSLSDAGVSVVAVENADRAAMLEAVRRYSDSADDADAQAIVLVGRFAAQGDEVFYLGTEAEGTGVLDGMTAGLPVSALAELLTQTPGRGLLVLGAAGGLPDIDLPQGVTLVVTSPERAARLVEETLAEPGARLGAGDGIEARGFSPESFTFLRTEAAATRPQAAPGASDAEADYWRLTRSRDDATAYAAYLDRYPNGQFAAEAQARIAGEQATPEERAAAAEEALDLSREGRQGVQQDLSALGFDTRGVDGIFGSGTRGAIRGWQQDQGFPITGYLTAEQVSTLDRQGSQRREAQRAEDDALWAGMGQDRSSAELENYLERFPGGFHAAEARGALTELRNEQAADGGVAERERQIWRATRAENSVEGYRRYITAFPDGEFVADARAAIARSEGQPQPQPQGQPQPPQQDVSADAQTEAALGLTPATRRAVEMRLSQLGFEPGAVDGEFDNGTRSALRRYQQNAGLPQTGYVNQITAVRLLADTLRDVLR